VSDPATLVVDRPAEGVVRATLDRPERGNSMTPAMFDELWTVADDVRRDPTARVLVLTGAGRAFCAGYDLDEAERIPELGAVAFLDLQQRAARALSAIHELPIPVVAAVNGAAAGGGLSLALSADIRIGSPAAKFNAAFVRIGFSAGDLGASWLLPRLVGPAKAAELAFTGRIVEAEEAERLGLLNAVSADGALMEDVLAMCAQIVANSPTGVRLSKSALRLNQETSYAAAIELENRGQTLLTTTDDMREALTAFRAKRPPRFSGR
jgi:enoyl-CoA hydratase/carnithine racemase